VKSSTSDLLIANCDEFIYYDDLMRAAQQTPPSQKRGRRRTDRKEVALDQLLEIVRSLERDYDPLWGSLVKQTIRRVYPGFNESYYGYRTFSDLLKDAELSSLITLEYDESRGNYKIQLQDG
jgi:hypothetical protein